MLPKVLKNFNLFLDGRGYAGLVEQVTLPKLIHRTEEFRLGGLDTPVQVDMGMEKLECEFSLSEYDVFIIRQFGIVDESKIPIQLRGSGFGGSAMAKIPFTLRGGLSDEMNNTVLPVAIFLQGSVIELDLGQWKAGENPGLRIRLALRYYRLELNEKELIEIDVDNRVRRVDGQNQIGFLFFR